MYNGSSDWGNSVTFGNVMTGASRGIFMATI
jgi:hypothetical protein